MLTETNGAGAPFPHCCAAHGASGGPRAPPEASTLTTIVTRGEGGEGAQQVQAEPAAAVRRFVQRLRHALHTLQVQRALLTVDDHLLGGSVSVPGTQDQSSPPRQGPG